MLPGLKMSRKMRSFCAALLLTLASVYAARRSLNCINDLITCHQSERTNILELLHWFACEVNIDRNNIIQLTFDPNSGAYGCHYYRNKEGLLESLPWGYRYYTIGNTHKPGSVELPSYVVNSWRGNVAWNSARILISVNEGGQIDQVYITQHYDMSKSHGSNYDPDHTYRITTTFLRQLKKLSINEILRLVDGSQTGPFRNTSDVHSQQVLHPKKDIQIDMPDAPPAQDDCLQNCICNFFCSIFVILIILVILGSYIGSWRK